MIYTDRNTFTLDTFLPAGLFLAFLLSLPSGVLVLPGLGYRTNSSDSYRLEYAQATLRLILLPVGSFFASGENYFSIATDI